MTPPPIAKPQKWPADAEVNPHRRLCSGDLVAAGSVNFLGVLPNKMRVLWAERPVASFDLNTTSMFEHAKGMCLEAAIHAQAVPQHLQPRCGFMVL